MKYMYNQSVALWSDDFTIETWGNVHAMLSIKYAFKTKFERNILCGSHNCFIADIPLKHTSNLLSKVIEKISAASLELPYTVS